MADGRTLARVGPVRSIGAEASWDRRTPIRYHDAVVRMAVACTLVVAALASVGIAGCGGSHDTRDAVADATSEAAGETGDDRSEGMGDAIRASDVGPGDASDAGTGDASDDRADDASDDRADDASDDRADDASDAAPDAPPEDRSPPTVTSRIPAPGATEVWVRDPIVVTFSEPIAAATLTDTSVVISDAGGARLARTLALSADGTSLAITLARPVAVPGQLTATLTNAITDLAGNALVAPDPWSWTVPRWITHGGSVGCGTNPLLALDRDGRPVVAWNYCDGDKMFGLRVRRWTGSGWEVLDDPTQTVAPTSIVGAPDGGIFISMPVIISGVSKNVQLWRGGDGPGRMVGSPVRAVASMTTPEITGVPQVRVAPDGTVLLSWAELSTFTQKHVSRWTGQAWENLGDGDPIMTTGRDAFMRLDAAGTPYLVWKTYLDTFVEPVSAARWSGTAWQQLGGPQQTSNCGCGDNLVPNHASMAVNAGGSVAAAWRESKIAGTQLFEWVHVWNGTSWLSLGDGLAGNMYYVEETSVGVDDAGGVVAAFIEDENVGTSSQGADIYVRSWNGSAMGRPRRPRHRHAGDDQHRPEAAALGRRPGRHRDGLGAEGQSIDRVHADLRLQIQ